MISAQEKIDVVVFRDTAHSFLKAYLLKLSSGATMLPENQGALHTLTHLAHTYTHRFALEQLLLDLPPAYQDLFNSQKKEFQLLIKELNWLLYHKSANKYFIARKVLDRIFTDCDFIPVLKQECFEGVQLQRYVQDVKREYYLLLHSKPTYQWAEKCVYHLTPVHPIENLLARVLASQNPQLKIILKYAGQTVLMHGEHLLSLAVNQVLMSEDDFDRLWQRHFKIQPVLPMGSQHEGTIKRVA